MATGGAALQSDLRLSIQPRQELVEAPVGAKAVVDRLNDCEWVICESLGETKTIIGT